MLETMTNSMWIGLFLGCHFIGMIIGALPAIFFAVICAALLAKLVTGIFWL